MQDPTAPFVLDPGGSDIQGEIARIRAQGPVSAVELPGGVRAWSVTDAALLEEILAGPQVSKDARQHWPAFRNGEISAEWPLLPWVAGFVLGEIEISKGDAILAGYAGASRDPKIHGATADEFDPTRAVKDHLAFGYGAHHCLGASLARLEAVVALPAIFRRFPDMELAAAPEELGVVPSFISNGHHRLPVYLNGK
ncbi:cytochrome P450 [Nocardia fusca]|uniref:cytochrome P450 n=1 Tax=Nocardia fusca TaxID=941183 RepID=UPI0007A737AA|nr:cytochrome P450 [Nocardia fusca]